MNIKVYIFLDLVLATILAVLGNIVASYLQEKFKLTDPARIAFVIVLFVVCLGLLMFITLKRSSINTGEQSSGEAEIKVKQQLGDIKKGGAVTGIEVDGINNPASLQVEQKAENVSDELTGVRIGTLGGPGTDKNRRKS